MTIITRPPPRATTPYNEVLSFSLALINSS
jgi:hypothetical protein